jgi:drug/metabolite transporter (DMT)-like permease
VREGAVSEGAAADGAAGKGGGERDRRFGRISGNARGILLMLVAMAAFVCGDAMMKLAGARVPTGEAVFIRGLFASLIVWTAVALSGMGRFVALAFTRPVALRSAGDVGGSLLFQSGLSRMPFADASAVLQINPLLVTAGAAVFLGEKVGWRRWSATAIGFLGVLLIIRPGSSAFNWWSIVLIFAVICAATRDLVTRKIDPGLPALIITAISVTAVMLASLLLAPFESWVVPARAHIFGLAGAGALMLAGQICVVISIRSGDVSAVVPFRYSAILWSILAGGMIWGEFPDRITLLGIAIVAGAGLYTFFREQHLRRMAARR